jgi:mRNA interferase MazF
VTLLIGDVVWAEFGPAHGREQHGRCPAVVVSSNDYLASVDALALVVPVTSRDRGWPNHVPLGGLVALDRPSFGMTEQVTTISRDRIVSSAGAIDEPCLQRIQMMLRAFLGL